MVEALQTVKQKLLEALAFAGVTADDIDSLFKIAEPVTCSVLYVSWRKEPYWVIFKISPWEVDEDLKNKGKLVTVKIQTRKQSTHKKLKHTQVESEEFRAELGPALV